MNMRGIFFQTPPTCSHDSVVTCFTFASNVVSPNGLLLPGGICAPQLLSSIHCASWTDTGIGAASLAADSGTLGGWQGVPAAGFDGSQSPDSYFTDPAAGLPVSSVTVDGTDILATLASVPSVPSVPVAPRYPASSSIKSGSIRVLDGCAAHGQAYALGSNQSAPAQVRGSYADGSAVGVMGIVKATAA